MLVHHNKWAIISSVYIACSTLLDENVFKMCYEHFQLSPLFQEMQTNSFIYIFMKFYSLQSG